MPMGSHFWTTDPNAEGLLPASWLCESVVFHILADAVGQLPSGAVPLYRFCDADQSRHFLTLDRDGEALPRGVFRLDKVVGHVWPTPEPGTVPLHRWFNLHEGRHFWGTDLTCDRVPWPEYKLEATVCHVYPKESPTAQTKSLVPVFRWRTTLGLHEWQIEIYRAIQNSAGEATYQPIARQAIRADDWMQASAKANQILRELQPADGFHVINGRCDSPF